MSDYGLIIPERGQNIDNGKLQYDTREQRLNVGLLKDPKHADIIEVNGGSNWVTQLQVREEIIFSMEHGFNFVPEALVYFYVQEQLSTPPYSILEVGFYNGALIAAGGGGYVEELRFKTTSTQFQIIHRAEEFFNSPMSSVFNHYKFQVKYYVLPIDSGMEYYQPSFDVQNM